MFLKQLRTGAIVLMICLMVTSCSTDKKLTTVINSYVNYPVNDLKKQLGEPKNTLVSDGNPVYVYGFHETQYIPETTVANTQNRGGAHTSFNRNSAYTSHNSNITTTVNNYGGYYQNTYCVLKFFTKNNKISSGNFEGNSCSKYAKHKYVNPNYILDLPKLYQVIYGIEYKKNSRGIKITEVREGSNAAKSGLMEKDLVIALNDKNIVGLPIEFTDDIFEKNKEVTLTVLRDKEKLKIAVEKTKFSQLSLYPKSIKKFLGFN
ncbi:MAG: PDZ domain-containing protein [Candidatus Caenarcaniphilales bacterium]|nr:PDZ domain-containing protein [Candidatus Caenarcaniphilales bacterium]